MEVGFTHRISRSIVSIGVHSGFSYRNFGLVADIYGDIHDSLKDENEALQFFGYFFGYGLGWVLGFGTFGAGPHVVLSQPKVNKPWVSLGTEVFLMIDPDLEPKTIRGHAGRLAVGYDITRDFGISITGIYAPADGGGVFGTTGPAVAMIFATLDLRGMQLFKSKK